jgi:ElaB/YqjD/DUF883 family membrane-anchored ribosome-binding protein
MTIYTPEHVAQAEARIKETRARLLGTLAEVQERFSPSSLAQDAVESATQGVATMVRKGTEAVRSRPLAVAGAAGAIGLVLARGWIGDIIKGRRHETAPAPDSLKSKPAPRPRRRAKKGTAS